MTHYAAFIPAAEELYSGRSMSSRGGGRDLAAYLDAARAAKGPTIAEKASASLSNTAQKTATFVNTPAGKTTAGGLTGLVLGGLVTGGPIGAVAGAAAGIYLGARGMGNAVGDIGKASSYLIDRGVYLTGMAMKYGSKAYQARQLARARAAGAPASPPTAPTATAPTAPSPAPAATPKAYITPEVKEKLKRKLAEIDQNRVWNSQTEHGRRTYLQLRKLESEVHQNKTPEKIAEFNDKVDEFNPYRGLIGEPKWNYWGS
jgi:pyruvate/2-oxoglutarate dehydrogenase complex dihydrolipoamide acyltransferase (E2) component